MYDQDDDITVTICRRLPAWILRAIVALPWRGHLWGTALLEIWERNVARLSFDSDDEVQAHPCVPPDGVQ